MSTLMKSVKKSLLNWEDSYFGGYERVVYDHPFISTPKEIGYDFKNTTGMTWYAADKLCRIFLLKVSRYGIFKSFLEGAEMQEKTTFTGETVRTYTISRRAKKACIRGIVATDKDMANLFKEYTDFLIDVDYYIAVPPPKSDDGVSASSSEGDDKKEMSDADKMENLLGDVKVQVPTWAKNGESVSGTLKEKTKFVVMDKMPSPTVFLPEQVRLGNSLVNLLDISFEPKEDKIENLLSGKMSAHKVSSAIAGDTHIYHKIEQDVSTRPFSICVLGDESGSMRGGGRDNPSSMHWRQNNLFKVLYYAFSQILPPSKMFFYGHSGVHNPEIRVYHELYNPHFEHTIDKQLYNDYSENYDGPVIENVYERVRQQTSDNVIFISISDGAPSGHRYGGPAAIRDMKRVIEKCKRDGFVTLGIGLHYGMVKEIYNYHTIIHNTDKMVQSVSSLINRVVKTEFKD